MSHLLFLPCFLLCSVSALLYGQEVPRLFVVDENVEFGQVLEADVQVANFNEIVSTSFTLRWNPAHLRYVGLDNLALDIIPTSNNFGLMEVEQGVLSFLWLDNDLEGSSLPDDAILFTVRLEAIAQMDTQTEVTFSSQPTPQEISDTSFTALPAEYLSGEITIMGPSAVREPGSELGIELTDAYPNPFQEQTLVRWQMHRGATTVVSLLDASGRTIWEDTRFYGAGKHQLPVHGTTLPEAGTYYLQITAGTQTVTQKLVFVGR